MGAKYFGAAVKRREDPRLIPGTGGIDLSGLVRALPFGLPLSLEIPNDEWLPKLGAEEWGRRALIAARRIVEGTVSK